MKTHIISILTAITTVTGLTGCNPNSGKTNADKTANLVYVNWAEGVAYTHLAEAVLRDKMGFDVELTAADVAPGYIAVAQGSHDAFMECWPSLHKDYIDRYSDKLVSLGTVYEGTETGLAVPSYVTIDKISELNDYADQFGGKITGVDAGAGMMKRTEDELIPQYGLDKIELMASSGPAMTAALADAIKHKKWIVVTAWKPHWMFGRWDLKFLQQDDDKIMWESGNIEIIGRSDLETDKPELAAFLKAFQLTDAQLSDLMLKVNDSDESVSEVAQQWMLDNEDVVAQWLPAAE
ncbi:glycine betaine ABC transporter substrate-binding protein [Pontiellaceae bacterium B1224]|nr:glycine betaine ABC transporter substrate-binding protein [Pontiellaceae bacterium B1224]